MGLSNRLIERKKKLLKSEQFGQEWTILSSLAKGLFGDYKSNKAKKKADKKAAQTAYLEEVKVISKKGFQFKENAPIFIQVGAMAVGLVVSRVALSKLWPGDKA